RMRVAELLDEVRHHRIEHARVHRRGRLIVEINRLARLVAAGPGLDGCRCVVHSRCLFHAAGATESTRGAPSRAHKAVHASTKRSKSSAVLRQPALTRMALPASGAAPIAARTCDALTLPDEQAEPALTATPARSSAITCVSAPTPGMATQIVL